MNLILKDVPTELHRELKRRAEQNHRSLNMEVIDILEQVVDPKPVDVEELLAEARQLRESVPDLLITDPLLREARDWGRQ